MASAHRARSEPSQRLDNELPLPATGDVGVQVAAIRSGWPVMAGFVDLSPGPVPATWRLELDDWSPLSRPQRRRFAVIVGDAGGEWWGGGCAEFKSRQDVMDCAQRLAAELGLVAHYFYRISP